MKKHEIITQLNTQQVVQLRILLGKLNNTSNLYNQLDTIVKGLGIKHDDTYRISQKYIPKFSHLEFQDACKDLVFPRKTIELVGKVYYVAELEEALENLSEVR